MKLVNGYTRFGGQHSETAALANCLAAQGVRAPHTGQPYTEAMLLGVGGGLGAGYILWEFAQHHARVLVLGFRIQWQYPVKFLPGTAERLGAPTRLLETGSRAAAARHLLAALAAGRPAVAWVDRAHMPYLQLPDVLKGHIGHIVAMCGGDETHALVDDLAAQPFPVTHAALAEARARITSYKHRLLTLEPGAAGSVDLPAAVLAGLRDCVANLLARSDSFSLPAIAKWARMMTDPKNKKGWPNLFSRPAGLYAMLKSTFEGVELIDTGGGGLRGLYARFLDEAAPLVDRPALHEVAAAYRGLAARWTDFAEAALPDGVEVFRETKLLLRGKHQQLMAGGTAAEAAARPFTQRIGALHAAVAPAFPLDAAGIRALFADLGSHLRALYEAELRAAHALREAVE